MQKIKNLLHLARAIIANIYFSFPTRKLIVIGVSGTDGKTTTSTAIYHILKNSGHKVAMVSTVGALIDDEVIETGLHVTTPGPFDIQRFAKAAYRKKCKYLVLEITSIGLDQHRDFGIKYKLGLITNLSHEHLDYHGSMENYAKAKIKLLKRSDIKLLTPNIPLISNAQFRNSHTYSFSQPADFTPKSFDLPQVFGDYNKENILGAAAACSLIGITRNNINLALLTFKLPLGRMQQITDSKKRLFFVDFGHTPQALDSTLASIKKTFPDKKIISVFGAAGLRDYTKRPLMGKAASLYSDLIIITSEDPRTEDQSEIANQIKSGFSNAFLKSKKYFEINNRQLAIKKAIELSDAKTVCLFFGKGHEKSMNINGKELPWDEVTVVEKALKN